MLLNRIQPLKIQYNPRDACKMNSSKREREREKEKDRKKRDRKKGLGPMNNIFVCQ